MTLTYTPHNTQRAQKQAEAIREKAELKSSAHYQPVCCGQTLAHSLEAFLCEVYYNDIDIAESSSLYMDIAESSSILACSSPSTPIHLLLANFIATLSKPPNTKHLLQPRNIQFHVFLDTPSSSIHLSQPHKISNFITIQYITTKQTKHLLQPYNFMTTSTQYLSLRKRALVQTLKYKTKQRRVARQVFEESPLRIKTPIYSLFHCNVELGKTHEDNPRSTCRRPGDLDVGFPKRNIDRNHKWYLR